MKSSERYKLVTQVRALRQEASTLRWSEAEKRLRQILVPLLRSEGYHVEREVFDRYRVDRMFARGAAPPLQARSDDGVVNKRVLTARDLDRPPDFIARRPATPKSESVDIIIELKHSLGRNRVATRAVRQALGMAAKRQVDRALIVATSSFAAETRRLVSVNVPIEVQLVDLDDLDRWVSHLPTEQPDGVAEAIIQAVKDLSRKLAYAVATDPRGLAHIEWRDLERMLAEAFDGLGFDVTLTEPSKDKGRDIILECTISGHNRSYLIEAKHWRSGKSVGPGHVRRFVGVIAREKRGGGLMLSTSGYTDEAFAVLAEYQRVRLQLQGREKVASLCQTYVRAANGLWSPPQNLADVLFDGTNSNDQ